MITSDIEQPSAEPVVVNQRVIATQEEVEALRYRIAQIDGRTRLFRTLSGTECETVDGWAELFGITLSRLQLTANQLVLQVPELLLGYPKEIFRDLSPDEKGDFNTVIRRISEKLKAPDRREQRRRDLYALKQKRHECILAYAARARQYEFDSRAPHPCAVSATVHKRSTMQRCSFIRLGATLNCEAHFSTA